MRKLCILAVISASVLMAQCARKTMAPFAAAENMTPEQKVADVKKKYTAMEMKEGNALFHDKCNKCHKFFEPETRDVEKWERVLPRMCQRSGLSDAEAGKVRAWVLSNAPLQKS